jgi:hypothetical protein
MYSATMVPVPNWFAPFTSVCDSPYCAAGVGGNMDTHITLCFLDERNRFRYLRKPNYLHSYQCNVLAEVSV